MAEYGVTKAGFIRKPFDVIEKENQEKARALFGDDVDLSIYSPIGLFVQMLTWKSHVLWQELEKAYYANWLETAEGVNLERTVSWGGLTRKGAQKAFLPGVVFSGDPGKVVPENFKVETPQGVQFKTLRSGTVDANGEVKIDCIAIESGPGGAVPAGAVTIITEPLAGLAGVYNNTPSFGARDIETDVELRARYKTEGTEGVGSSIDAIRKAILDVGGVISASVYENVEIYNDGEGRDPKSIECIVFGGNNADDIAKAIFMTKPAGIKSCACGRNTDAGRVSVEVADGEFKEFVIDFSRPELVDIHVAIDLKVKIPPWEDRQEQIKENIIKYIGGMYEHADGTVTEFDGLPIGSDIFPWRIAALNDEIPGIEDITVRLMKNAPPGPDDKTKILIDNRELPRCGNSKIEINVTEA